MSVLIKGMEMPESCSDCFFDYDSIVCMALNKEFPDRSSDDGFYAYCSGRMPDCPLVEVSSEDVQPVEHGEWTVEGNDEYGNYWDECTVCRRAVFFPPSVKNDYKYCPHCGARMGDEDDV